MLDCGIEQEDKNMKIKIKKWEDLHGIKNEKCEIKISTLANPQLIEIQIKRIGGYLISVIETFYSTPNETVNFLKAFGFDVELEKPRKLTWREWCYCNVFPDCWIATDKYKNINKYNTKPEKVSNVWISDSYYHVPVGLFSWLTLENEPISTNEMLRWEHEPEPKCTFDE